ncbi:MAG TPA: outer membrane protein assembly factor BamD [Candidatus Cybelea sp.]|nr:outer membrane protein assembly factor BamD [Candidatus Cybelea sp.]
MTRNRNLLGGILFASLALVFCGSAQAQAVQAQTGSSDQGQQPPVQPQTQPAKPAQKPAPQAQKKHTKKTTPPHAAQQKKIKAHVVKQKPSKNPAHDTSQSAEPDKVLYERAMASVQKGRYTEGRLNLQTLINTYPDSEYLAKAKLAVADSYYKEGGTSNLTQAIEEYKNFIIFFPFLDEAAYAQMQVGMGHFRMMEKADRDTTQAGEAEQEFQTFLLKYPQSPLAPKAEQDLRDVQEVLADGEYKIARFYYIKRDYAAATARLVEVAERYPLYSQSDQTLWMLGDVYGRAKQASKNEDDKNHWADLAAKCYDRIVQDYPLSPLASAAKSRLREMGMAVPAVDPQALARMKQAQMYQRRHHQNTLVHFPVGMLKSGPSLETAARSGAPNLNPPDDAVSARDVLIQGAKGPDFDKANKPAEDPTQNANGTDLGAPVESTPAPAGSTPAGTNVGVQIITPPADAQPASQPQSPRSTPVPTTAAPTSAPADVGAPGAGTATPSSVEGGSAPPDPPAAQPAAATSAAAPQNAPANGQSAQDAQANAKPAKADKADPSVESSSKKKKGLKKLIPW